MAVVEPSRAHAPTHEVLNQAPPLVGYNAFEQDRPLVEALEREGGGWAARPRASRSGSSRAARRSSSAGRRTRTRPSCARTTATGTGSTRSSSTRPGTGCWTSPSRTAPTLCPGPRTAPGAHVARAAIFMALGQAEAGHGCPISMTYSAIPALRTTPELAEEWEPLLTSTTYDPRLVPGADKAGALCGMAMTEKQGGSDVRANTTTARPLNGGGPGRRVRDHRPQVVLLGADVRRVPGAGPGRRRPFLLPAAPRAARRHAQPLPPPAPQGQARQPLERVERGRVQRAPGRAWSARRAAASRRSSRWSTTRGSTACRLSRGHARGRRAGDPPRRPSLRLRQAPDRPAADAERARRPLRRVRGRDDHGDAPRARLRPICRATSRETLFKRLATAVSKYWICKRAPVHAIEALECLGGNGYVEESGMPRLYREAPLNSIWEGSGNVICLDVLRAMAREPASRSRPS